MTYTTFTKPSLISLRREMQAVLDKFAAENNIEFSIGKMTYSDNQVKMTVEAKVAGSVTPEDHMLTAAMTENNLCQEKNGRRLIRYDARKYQYPFIYTEGGKTFKTSVERAKRMFAA